MVVARYVDIYYASTLDRGGEEDGGKLDLEGGQLAQGRAGQARCPIEVVAIALRCQGMGLLTRRLSSVSRTATPASTLPTVRDTSMVYVSG